MNEKLLAPFTVEDVKKAVFSIGDFKAPGPDGIHAIFYKKFWDICGGEISQEVLHALNTGVIPEGWNDTTVVLIPKIDDPELIDEILELVESTRETKETIKLKRETKDKKKKDK
jgi:hypothetical protein